MKQLEDENREPRLLVTGLNLDKHILQDVVAKKLWRLDDGARSPPRSGVP